MKVHIPFMSSIGLCSTLPCGIAKRALDICPLVLSRRLTGPGGAAKTERINVSNKRVVLIQACRTVGIHAQPLRRLRRFCGSITNVLEVLGPNRRELTTSGRAFRPSIHCACCTYRSIRAFRMDPRCRITISRPNWSARRTRDGMTGDRRIPAG